VDWDRIEVIVDDAWRCVAPKRLVAAHEQAAGSAGADEP
jgi:hypothetical protein